jgi:hypothetical protein
VEYSYVGPEDEVEVFGLVFKKGQPVDVRDAHALGKLKNHAHFVSGTPVVETKVSLPEDTTEIDALREEAAVLGLRVDGRWSVNKIKAMIEQARKAE